MPFAARGQYANPQGVAVIIGNADYEHRDVSAVTFAHRDAAAFRRYVVDVLGFDPENVLDLRDATRRKLFRALGTRMEPRSLLWSHLDPDEGSDVVVFYSGHGVPGLNDGRGYLLPVDADPSAAEDDGYPIDLLYRNVGGLAEARSVRVYLDACFSGGSHEGGSLIGKASPAFVKPELPGVSGEKVTSLAAASGKQVASWDEEVGHGLFTHHLLDALYGGGDADGDGQVTALEAKGYLDRHMTRAALRQHERIQEASLVGVGEVVLASASGGVFPIRPELVDATCDSNATQRDKDMLGLDKAFEVKDYPEVLTFISKLEESGCVLPFRVDYYRGEAEFHAERYGEAVRSLERYVEKAGREGRHYRRAEELLRILDGDDTCNPKNATQRDKYMLGLDKALEAKDYSKVLDFISKLEESGCVLPPRVDYYRGEAEFHAERYGEAVRSLERYAEKAGPEGRHYRSSLELLLILEERDDTAYEQAKSEGTAAAYEEYLSSHPDGLHAAEARQRQEVAREAERERERERKRPGRRFRDCEECPELVVVPAGSFDMGSPESEAGRYYNEGPVHRVRLSEPFAVGVYEVTFSEWAACRHGGGCSHNPGDSGWGRGNRPVIGVNWEDAQEYVRWLSRETGSGYRLLSESEWEYAARGGTTGPFHFGGAITPGEANYDGNYTYGGGRKGRYRGRTVPVGSFPSNSFGLHDVHGNVWEWVEDCWHGSYRGAPVDGSAWTRGGDCGRRVLRGGSWDVKPGDLRSAVRDRSSSGARYSRVGFRVARTLD